jgi:hypothetical protein
MLDTLSIPKANGRTASEWSGDVVPRNLASRQRGYAWLHFCQRTQDGERLTGLVCAKLDRVHTPVRRIEAALSSE